MPTTPTTPTDTGTTVILPDQPVTVDTGAAAAPQKNFYAAVAANLPVVPSPSGGLASNLSYGAIVGGKNILFGLGARVGAFYKPGTPSVITADAKLMLDLGAGFFAPYAGFGGGASFASGSTTTPFVDGVVGLNLNFTDSLGLFVEANPNYTFASGGNVFGVNVKTGLKFSF